MTGKPLPFPYSSRSNSRENQDTSRHRRPNKYSFSNSKPYYVNSSFKLSSKTGSPYPRPQNLKKNQNIIITTITLIILDQNHLTMIKMEIVYDDHSQLIAFEMYEILLIQSYIKNK